MIIGAGGAVMGGGVTGAGAGISMGEVEVGKGFNVVTGTSSDNFVDGGKPGLATGGGVGDSGGGGSVVNAPTALQALRVSLLTALTFQK